MVERLILCALFLVVGGQFDAAMDKLAHHYHQSIFATWKNQLFWDASKSWENKWKPDPLTGYPTKQERFWGSSRWFVFTTDGWHLMQFFQLWCYAAATAVLINFPSVAWYVEFPVALLLMRTIVSTSFVIGYDVWMKR